MQLIAMIKHQLKLMLRNRLAIFATISVPLILTFLFSFSQDTDSKENLYIANADKSNYAAKLIEMIKEHKNIKVIKLTENELKKKSMIRIFLLGSLLKKVLERI